MSYLMFFSDGEIDLYALTLMGATTKRDDDSTIGFFGTGNKYAIACLLRNNIGIRIYSGYKEFKIETTTIKLGETEHELISIDGNATSLTTSMGPSWDVWQAVREIHSNALDCGGYTRMITDTVPLQKGRTCFSLELTSEIQYVVDTWDSYFSNERQTISVENKDSILDGAGTGTIYRKGIRCNLKSDENNSAFDYDLSNVSVNEDRIMADSTSVSTRIWNLIFASKKNHVHRRALVNSMIKGATESNNLSSFGFWPSSFFSEEFKEFVSSNMLAVPDWAEDMSPKDVKASIFINPILMSHFIDNIEPKNMLLPSNYGAGKKPDYELIERSFEMLSMVESCLYILNKFMSVSYEVKYARFYDQSTLAMAHDNCIILSEKVFHQGKTVVLAAIIEEYVHLEYGVRDCTRAMQDATFNLFATSLLMKGLSSEGQVIEEVIGVGKISPVQPGVNLPPKSN